MKPERTIQAMMDMWPTSCTTRQECLDHLFVVIGNGYEWFEGELCSLSGPDVQFVLDDPEDEDSDGHYVYTHDDRPDLEKAKHPWTEEDWENYRKERLEQQQRYYEEAIARMKAKFPGYNPKRRPPKYRETVVARIDSNRDRHWYPIAWDYSEICNLPDDITPEWKALADECKALLLEDGIDVDNRTVTPEAKEKYKIHYA
jgi:hypothetical protein